MLQLEKGGPPKTAAVHSIVPLRLQAHFFTKSNSLKYNGTATFQLQNSHKEISPISPGLVL